MQEEAENNNRKKEVEKRTLEEKTRMMVVIATFIGVCLAIACTKQILSPSVLTIYGVMLIISGLFIIFTADE